MITSGQTNKKWQLQRKLFTYMFIHTLHIHVWLLNNRILCCLLTLIACYYKQLLLVCKPSFSIPTHINLSISAIELNFQYFSKQIVSKFARDTMYNFH
jgi:hypothetical protein